ncbi:hypothetical protein R1sor_018912 [Riccia sorocarpa]|uniref:Pre-mRNA processing factor 4 (PRP4)-like domain-containing protein n=1 Tax=Riccia sorocarpa TaxID=122646 RepID=A0ABD3IB13_9MARC
MADHNVHPPGPVGEHAVVQAASAVISAAATVAQAGVVFVGAAAAGGVAEIAVPSGAGAASQSDGGLQNNRDEEMLEADEDEKGSAPGSPSKRAEGGDGIEYEVSEESKKARERQEQKVQQLLMRRRANALAVPTNDAAVRARLRSLQQPITLFGEREMDRRDRLRAVMARLDADGELEKLLQAQEAAGDGTAGAGLDGAGASEEVQEPEVSQLEIFYTEGSEELREARMEILKFSLPRAATRIGRAQRKRADPDEDEDAETEEVLHAMSQTSMVSRSVGDDRPLSACALSPDGSLLATSSWSGQTKLWEVPQIKRTVVLKGHTERVTGVAFHPQACKSLSNAAGNIVTGSADRKAILWNLEGTRLRSFEGHLERLARVAFHPTGAYLGTASYDKTWRLWDINTGTELLLQEGHSRAVYGLAFQKDGALAASCGLDALARVWDMRTGRSILALEGHVKSVLSLDFSPNGYHLATGSEDHTCRVWDLRKKKSLYIIPAHSSIVSQVKYEPSEGYFLVTASFDKSARIWSARDFKPVKTLAGHEGKVMDVDVSEDGQYIATVSSDRAIMFWSHLKA